MGKRKSDTAVIAAIAVVAVVAFSTARAFMGTTHDSIIAPTPVATGKANHPIQVPTQDMPPATEVAAPMHSAPPIILYDVPLATELQLHIIQVAESYDIDPAIIFAMCYRESSYNPASIGDHGAAFGLMQIQPKWHSDRMARLGCMDLLDPYQNVIVGADYLAEQRTRYGGDISKALVAYNAGHYMGTITKYAMAVLATAEELRGTTYEEYR